MIILVFGYPLLLPTHNINSIELNWVYWVMTLVTGSYTANWWLVLWLLQEARVKQWSWKTLSSTSVSACPDLRMIVPFHSSRLMENLSSCHTGLTLMWASKIICVLKIWEHIKLRNSNWCIEWIIVSLFPGETFDLDWICDWATLTQPSRVYD